jgi:hypothetical protein
MNYYIDKHDLQIVLDALEKFKKIDHFERFAYSLEEIEDIIIYLKKDPS